MSYLSWERRKDGTQKKLSVEGKEQRWASGQTPRLTSQASRPEYGRMSVLWDRAKAYAAKDADFCWISVSFCRNLSWRAAASGPSSCAPWCQDGGDVHPADADVLVLASMHLS